MTNNNLSNLQAELTILKNDTNYSLSYRRGHSLYMNGQCVLLSQSGDLFNYSVFDEYDDFRVAIRFNEKIEMQCNCKSKLICQHKVAGLIQTHEELTRNVNQKEKPGIQYTRKGMIKRVVDERAEKAKSLRYRLVLAENIHGEHKLFNESEKLYKITLRDFKKELGHCSCPDFKTNKLGTCKHLMFTFDYFNKNKRILNNKSNEYPFIEIYLDPLNNYQISWYYPGRIGIPDITSLLYSTFGKSMSLPNEKVVTFLSFLNEAQKHKQILIRPEVYRKVEKAYNQNMLEQVRTSTSLNYSFLNIELFDYQKQGVEFAVFRDGAIIADEMGLGKTLQAIATAILKKELFGFKNCIIICPASLKEQWKNEIEKFTNEKAIVIQGFPEERKDQYLNSTEYFTIVNYETVLRDKDWINQKLPDFIILDEAQRIKNYDTLTSRVIKSLKKKHALIITGTPIENRLTDLYSVVSFINPEFLSPLWEFSYEHYYFDPDSKNKIVGYYNLANLKKKLNNVLIRREKKQVIEQLPKLSQIDVPITMHPEQEYLHGGFARGVAAILAKKFKTAFDWQNLMYLLTKMRMTCDSTFLVDHETNYSPKLTELKQILFEKFDIANQDKKIIIFSEWVRMNNIIGKMLRENNIQYVELNGKIPVKNRGKLIKEFEDNSDCKVFLSTDAGGVGLNLQVADTVINFEVPWNPAKKNQRIGRIDRIGQLKDKLTVINLITRNSIEMKIASGLFLKQKLFDGVLNPENSINEVNFNDEGRSQFLRELQEIVDDFTTVDDAMDDDAQAIIEINEDKDNIEEIIAEETQEPDSHKDDTPIESSAANMEQIETVMNHGMEFLAGLYKISTGKELLSNDQKVTIDKKTGEITMKFKMPM